MSKKMVVGVIFDVPYINQEKLTITLNADSSAAGKQIDIFLAPSENISCVLISPWVVNNNPSEIPARVFQSVVLYYIYFY
jgi:hypothetical protein